MNKYHAHLVFIQVKTFHLMQRYKKTCFEESVYVSAQKGNVHLDNKQNRLKVLTSFIKIVVTWCIIVFYCYVTTSA